jgi:hypothetical protein
VTCSLALSPCLSRSDGWSCCSGRSGLLSLDMAVTLLPSLAGMLGSQFDACVPLSLSVCVYFSLSGKALDSKRRVHCHDVLAQAPMPDLPLPLSTSDHLSPRGDSYVVAALNGALMLLKSFGDLIHNTRAAAAGAGRGVDVVLEERYDGEGYKEGGGPTKKHWEIVANPHSVLRIAACRNATSALMSWRVCGAVWQRDLSVAPHRWSGSATNSRRHSICSSAAWDDREIQNTRARERQRW